MLSSLTRKFSQPRLLYIGLGEMGYPLSGTLSKTFPTQVWNRTFSKAEKHANEYKTTAVKGKNPFANDLSEIDLIFTCLPTSKEVNSFADLLINSKSPRKSNLVWVDNTSGVPKISKEIAKKLEENQIGFIDAPVSGGRAGALAGQLAVMVGGPLKYYEKAAPVLQTLAKSLIHIDEQVGSGHAVKAYNNLLYACNIILAMKAAQSLEANGINVDKALSIMMAGSGGSNSMQRVHKYATNNRKIDYNFKTKLLIKDMDIGLSLFGEAEKDSVLQILKKIRKIYNDAAKPNWDESDVFDLYSFIETKKNPKL